MYEGTWKTCFSKGIAELVPRILRAPLTLVAGFGVQDVLTFLVSM